MDLEFKEKLDTILKKDLTSLLPSDIVFLKARRSYLTEEQMEKYNGILEDKKPNEPQKTYRELQDYARSLGLKVRVGLRREQLEQMIEDAENKL